jgi:hypothetical protein
VSIRFIFIDVSGIGKRITFDARDRGAMRRVAGYSIERLLLAAYSMARRSFFHTDV